MSGEKGGLATGINLGTTYSCVGFTDFDAKKQEDDEAKQLLVDMIVNETMGNTTFRERLRETKVDDTGKNAWDKKRKQEKEELKKKRDEMRKKREEQQKDKAMGKKKKK